MNNTEFILTASDVLNICQIKSILHNYELLLKRLDKPNNTKVFYAPTSLPIASIRITSQTSEYIITNVNPIHEEFILDLKNIPKDNKESPYDIIRVGAKIGNVYYKPLEQKGVGKLVKQLSLYDAFEDLINLCYEKDCITEDTAKSYRNQIVMLKDSN